MINIGDILDNRYRITEFLGSGGMAEVYEANDFIANRYVAIKILKPEFINDIEIVEAFKNEIKISSLMSHPNIVSVYNEGVFNKRPYIVIEYVKEQTLANKLDYLTRFSLDEAISIMEQLLDALQYTHEHKLIHRDVKPQNIFYFSNGTIKLGDFGIAKEEDKLSSSIVGSIHYLAPEVISGRPYSIRSDVYAAGITFFELITGRLPFDVGKTIDIAHDQKFKQMPHPSKIIDSIPKEIDEIILKATAKNPINRYMSAFDFKKALENFKNGISNKESLIKKIFKNI